MYDLSQALMVAGTIASVGILLYSGMFYLLIKAQDN
jgi:hypothetical protein